MARGRRPGRAREARSGRATRRARGSGPGPHGSGRRRHPHLPGRSVGSHRPDDLGEHPGDHQATTTSGEPRRTRMAIGAATSSGAVSSRYVTKTSRIDPSARATPNGTAAISRATRILLATPPSPGERRAPGRPPLISGPPAGDPRLGPATSSSPATTQAPAASRPAANQPPSTSQITAPIPTEAATTMTSIGIVPNAMSSSVGPRIVPIPTAVGRTTIGSTIRGSRRGRGTRRVRAARWPVSRA
jgi:hypothetical protein